MTTTPRIKMAMIIDDEQADQMLYKLIIKRSGLIENTLAFQMAEDALDYLKSEDKDPIDVNFLDINMPRMNGFEFLERATAELDTAFAKCVVIMLTTSLDPMDEARARKFDVVKDYLNKPLNVDDISKVAALVQDTA